MVNYQMGELEGRFADIIWENEPVSSAELAALGEKAFGWKKTTAYTVLKRLCLKGIFQNTRGVVSSCLSRDRFYAEKSVKFVDDFCGGSLSAFVCGFCSCKKLNKKEAEEVARIIKENTKSK